MIKKVLVTALVTSMMVCPVQARPTSFLTESYLAQEKLEDLGAEVPEEIAEAVEKYAEEYGISPELVTAIIWKESRFVPSAKGGSCLGLMQIHTSSHRGRMKKLGVTDIYDIDQNIHTGCDYLAELFEMYGDPGTVLAAYNGDTKALRSNTVSKYAESILELATLYEKANGK